jgi:hypothetical protein
MKKEMDLYTNYLLSSLCRTVATGLSNLPEWVLSNDKITCILSGYMYSSKRFRQEVKALVKKHGSETACLIIDDTTIKKPYKDENDLICWHLYHREERNKKEVRQHFIIPSYPRKRLILYASLLAHIKLERLKFIHKMNHFALKAKVYFVALKMALEYLNNLKYYLSA